MSKKYKVDNAIIMAAGISSRFAPLSYERPKALINVKGEVLIERQIQQIYDAGIKDVYIVTGYKSESFQYLKDKYGLYLIHNTDYACRNNNSSIYAAKEVIKNTYICSADNYFSLNPFETEVEDSYYSAVYAEGMTKEWCMQTNTNGNICNVQIGGENAWFMLGHAFWAEPFSNKFLSILNDIYDIPETGNKLWESLFMENLNVLPMKMRKYPNDIIYEFDSLDELREFDISYHNDTRSEFIKKMATKLKCNESELNTFRPLTNESGFVFGFSFDSPSGSFQCDYMTKTLKLLRGK